MACAMWPGAVQGGVVFCHVAQCSEARGVATCNSAMRVIRVAVNVNTMSCFVACCGVVWHGGHSNCGAISLIFCDVFHGFVMMSPVFIICCDVILPCNIITML